MSARGEGLIDLRLSLDLGYAFFLAYARHSGYVVGAVSHETFQVNKL